MHNYLYCIILYIENPKEFTRKDKSKLKCVSVSWISIFKMIQPVQY